MNVLDIIILSLIALLVIRGVFRGFFRETASLAGLVLGLWLSGRFQPLLTGLLKAYFPRVSFLAVIAFAAIFLAVLVLCNLAGLGLKLLFKKALLGWLDRLLGAGLAVAKGVLISYVGIILLTFYFPPSAVLIAGSVTAPLITVSTQSMIRLLSPEHYRRLRQAVAAERHKRGEGLPEKPREKRQEQ